MSYTYLDDSFAGIVAAFNQLRLANNTPVKEYPASYAGIRDAILDIKKEWGNIGTGEFPPGWQPIYDEDGNVIGGDWQFFPQEGDLWFDERQGRLMVYINGEFHQTNGADQLTVVSETQPTDALEGGLWYQPSNLSLYIYDGTQWALITSNATTTATLALAAPTRSVLSSAPTTLPNTDGLQTQQDFNNWVYDALDGIDTSMGALGESGAQVTVTDDAPTITEDGEFWWNSGSLQLFVSYSGFWVAASPGLTGSTEFTTLNAQVQSLQATLPTNISTLTARVSSIESDPGRSYTLSTPAGIRLISNDNLQSDVSITATDGINVQFGTNSIAFDASAMQSSVIALQDEIGAKALQSDLSSFASTTTANEATLSAEISANTTAINSLTSVVNTLPTQSQLSATLPLSGGSMTGPLDMAGQKTINVPAPFSPGDAVNRQYVDDFKTLVASTYATKNGSTFSSLSINTSDTEVAGIDFSSSVVSSSKAMKLTADGTNDVTFGTTDYANELAWNFTGSEDFCWKHETTGKQLSVKEDGVVCAELSLANFVVNNNGDEILTNTIDVRDRLTKFSLALTNLRSALASSSSFEEFKTQGAAALSGI